MKMTSKIMALGLLIISFASCEKHDFFDETTITGAVGPEAYWDIESAAMKAGGMMGFTAQYYSSKEKISHSEVWYDINEKVDKTVSCPLVKSLTYNYTSSVLEKKRITQMIQRYPHSEDLWNDSLSAYVLEDYFTVSGTLTPIMWVQPNETPEVINQTVDVYFGPKFRQSFKDGLKEKMTYAAYIDVFQGLDKMDTTYIKLISDSSYNNNTSLWVKDFKKDTIKGGAHDGQDSIYVEPWITDTINKLWEQVQFTDLVLGSEGYAIEYQKSYIINAELRVFDEKGTYSQTVSKEIAVN